MKDIIDVLCMWVSFKETKPSKDGSYLVLAHSADKEKPFCHVAWWSLSKNKWDLIPSAWGEAIEYWSILPVPKDF